MNLDYNTIISKIKEKTNLPESEIQEKVDQKLKKLGDLISKEGAAHIIANELGVKLFEQLQRPQSLKIKDIIPGLNSVTAVGKVINLYDVKSFKTEKREGKVASLIIADETSSIRIVLWDNSLIELIEQKKIKVNNILKIKNAYSKQNDFGYKELHLGSKSTIEINPENEKILETVETQTPSVQLKKISDLSESESAEINGTIVQLFEPRFFFACPECGKKVNLGEDEKYSCISHGTIKEQKVPILNIFLDDGTDNIRVVLFKDLVTKLLGENLENFEEIKRSSLGRQLSIKGRAIKNQMFDRLEFRANEVNDLDPLVLIEKLKNDG